MGLEGGTAGLGQAGLEYCKDHLAHDLGVLDSHIRLQLRESYYCIPATMREQLRGERSGTFLRSSDTSWCDSWRDDRRDGRRVDPPVNSVTFYGGEVRLYQRARYSHSNTIHLGRHMLNFDEINSVATKRPYVDLYAFEVLGAINPGRSKNRSRKVEPTLGKGPILSGCVLCDATTGEALYYVMYTLSTLCADPLYGIVVFDLSFLQDHDPKRGWSEVYLNNFRVRDRGHRYLQSDPSYPIDHASMWILFFDWATHNSFIYDPARGVSRVSRMFRNKKSEEDQPQLGPNGEVR